MALAKHLFWNFIYLSSNFFHGQENFGFGKRNIIWSIFFLVWIVVTKYHNGGECALGMEAGTVCCVQPDRAPKGVGVPKNWLYYFVEKYFF